MFEDHEGDAAPGLGHERRSGRAVHRAGDPTHGEGSFRVRPDRGRSAVRVRGAEVGESAIGRAGVGVSAIGASPIGGGRDEGVASRRRGTVVAAGEETGEGQQEGEGRAHGEGRLSESAGTTDSCVARIGDGRPASTADPGEA